MASGLKRVGDLEIDQDLAFQHRTWTGQRIGWAVMGLLILAAVAGLFGHGPVSRAVADDPSVPVTLEYERFGRYQSPVTLRLHLGGTGFRDGALTLWLSQDYVSRVQIQSITPEPSFQRLSSTGIDYEFQLSETDRGGAVTLQVEPQTVGVLSGRIGLSPSQSFPFTQWIYP